MENVEHAIIIMAGIGSRLGLDTTKGLVKVGEKKIVDYHLDRLKDVPDVRIVVGFQKEKVKEHVKKVRDDVKFITNHDFRNTSTSYSVSLANKDLDEPYLLIIGDVLFNKTDFENFIVNCKNESLVGITPSKTEDAIFAELNDDNRVINFQREYPLDYEYAGITYVTNDVKITENDNYVVDALGKSLPLKTIFIESYEIDTKADLELAKKNLHKLELWILFIFLTY